MTVHRVNTAVILREVAGSTPAKAA